MRSILILILILLFAIGGCAPRIVFPDDPPPLVVPRPIPKAIPPDLKGKEIERKPKPRNIELLEEILREEREQTALLRELSDRSPDGVHGWGWK